MVAFYGDGDMSWWHSGIGGRRPPLQGRRKIAGDFLTDQDVHAQQLTPAVDTLLFKRGAGMEDGQGGDGVAAAQVVGTGAEAFEVLEWLLE
jgi:hypothetical protein